MASGLRAKLKMIGSAAPAAASKPMRECGLVCYADRRPIPEGIMNLPPEGLKRIGGSGRVFDIHRCLFLDTETTGLSHGAGTVAFLVGLGYVQNGEFVVEQYLMRDYPDEPELIARVAQVMQRFDTVCTFNGKTFDLPLLQTRFTMCRMREQWKDMEQIDLLHPARRTWKLRIGSCRLCRIEEYILGQPRSEDDLPGSEVPQRYFEFLKTGKMELLNDIIEHNRQDIYTLGLLLVHLCRLYAHPECETRKPDLYSMGRALETQGELVTARELYRLAAIPAPAGSIASLVKDDVGAQASWRLYLLARKNCDPEAMRSILEQMANRRQLREKIYIELAKLYEHQFKNPRRALQYADLAAQYIPPEEHEALDRRRERLKAKLERKTKNGTF